MSGGHGNGHDDGHGAAAAAPPAPPRQSRLAQLITALNQVSGTRQYLLLGLVVLRWLLVAGVIVVLWIYPTTIFTALTEPISTLYDLIATQLIAMFDDSAHGGFIKHGLLALLAIGLICGGAYFVYRMAKLFLRRGR